MARGTRLDQTLVQRGFFPSRQQAQLAIMAGEVRVDGRVASKASDSIKEQSEISLTVRSRYVGRGGTKLEGALAHFGIDCGGKIALDIGASTGGFTDCLLQHGARRVVAVDVGHNQIDWSLRKDDRVEVREGINARYLRPEDFTEAFDLAVMDVSFISATKVMPAIVPLLAPHGRLILLIKPQFEVGRGEVGKGGIVREPEKRARVISEVNEAARELGLATVRVIESPLHGADGNVEFLALYERVSDKPDIE